MTDPSTSPVGRAAIEAYLDSVELALIAANAPRIDRLQVLQDLEAQIADMLAREPEPLSEESVQAVIDRLEPPSHFAATYGNGAAKISADEVESESPSRSHRFSSVRGWLPRLPRIPWPAIAATSCALFVLSFALAVFAAASNARGFVDIFSFLSVLTFFVTPITIWLAYRQLRAEPDMSGRDLVPISITIYTALALAVLMLFLAVISEGFFLIVFGIVAFFYFEYRLIRQLWRRMSDSLPPQPASSSAKEANGNGGSSPITTATPMPAV